MGYETQQIVLLKKETKNLIVILKEESTSLEEVLIVSKPKKRLPKKENPAYKILKKIWKNIIVFFPLKKFLIYLIIKK